MTSDVDQIRRVNEAIASGDLESVSGLLRADVVWEHNIGAGTPEEGVYEGRESVTRLFERILEGWEQLRPEPREIRDLGDGSYLVSGELRAKHRASASEVVTPYVQLLEMRDGRFAKGRMTVGAAPDAGSEQVALVKQTFDAYARGDFDGLVDLLHPDVELHEWPEGPDPRTYHGPDGIRQAREVWEEAWESVTAEPLQWAEAGDRVFVSLHSTARGRGSSVEVELNTFGVYTIRDSKVARIEFFTDRDAALTAAGLSGQRTHEEER